MRFMQASAVLPEMKQNRRAGEGAEHPVNMLSHRHQHDGQMKRRKAALDKPAVDTVRRARPNPHQHLAQILGARRQQDGLQGMPTSRPAHTHMIVSKAVSRALETRQGSARELRICSRSSFRLSISEHGIVQSSKTER